MRSWGRLIFADRRPAARSLASLAAAAVIAATLAAPAVADNGRGDFGSAYAAGQPVVKNYKLGLNKSAIIDLPRDAGDILVSNPGIADAVIRTSRRIYLTGVAIGQADVFVFDPAGAQILHLNLEVERDNAGLERTLRRLIPGSNISVEVVNDNIVLNGTVKNAGDANKAQSLAAAFANGGQNTGFSVTGVSQSSGSFGPTGGGGTTTSSIGESRSSGVVNLLSIEGEDQVQLKVAVVEMQRNVAKQLGINLDLNGIVNNIAFGAITDNPFLIAGKALSRTSAGIRYRDSHTDVAATIRAMEQDGVLKTLAEPTLTAISGESANFLAGGEFPVPAGYDDKTNTLTYVFKTYGVALSFTPVVLSEGRISLRVKTEVSELSTEGAVSLGGDVSIPSLKVRRAESTIELPAGGTVAMGGLLQDNVKQAIAGTPGLMNIPVLGALFKSRDFQRNQTELVIMVTPYLVKPVARGALARPDDNFEAPSDGATVFLGQLNRIYGTAERPPLRGAYHGNYGYIFD